MGWDIFFKYPMGLNGMGSTPYPMGWDGTRFLSHGT
jgi:hypothetical protein